MVPVSDNSSVLPRLRHETRPYHEALEQNAFNQALGAGRVTPEATEFFLSKLYGFLKPYESALDAQHFPAEWEVGIRRRAHLIAQDLPTVTALPLCPDMPPLHTRPQLLGAMYVLEGSTLGGQVIARQLAKSGISTRTYFTGYAERTGPMWKNFCGLLTAAATYPHDQAEIVHSAVVTFQKLHAWIEQPY